MRCAPLINNDKIYDIVADDDRQECARLLHYSNYFRCRSRSVHFRGSGHFHGRVTAAPLLHCPNARDYDKSDWGERVRAKLL